MGAYKVELVLGVILIISIIYMLLKQKTNEGISLVWIALGIVTMIQSLFPYIIDRVAGWLGIDYPPMLGITAIIIFLTGFALYLSSELAVTRAKINELTIHISLLNNDVRDLKEKERDGEKPERGQIV